MAKLSRRSFISLSMVLLIELASPCMASAHDKNEHNKELELVLLGESGYKIRHQGDTPGRGIRAIEAAAYLCIDQFQGYGSEELDWLKGNGFDVLDSLEEINFTASGRNHREYTHCGWEMTYEDDKAHWSRRKKILLDTVEKVFNFKALPSWLVGYDERCESFAALVYYIHVLGDFLEDDTLGKFEGESNGKKVKFARTFPTDKNPDIFWEIERHLGTLLLGQNTSLTYNSLMIDLKGLARRARKIARQRGDIEDSKFADAHECAEELMVLLSGHNNSDYSHDYSYKGRVHALLAKESYFNEVFPAT